MKIMLPDVIGHENQSQHYQHHRCLCLDLSGRITTPDRFSYHSNHTGCDSWLVTKDARARNPSSFTPILSFPPPGQWTRRWNLSFEALFEWIEILWSTCQRIPMCSPGMAREVSLL